MENSKKEINSIVYLDENDLEPSTRAKIQVLLEGREVLDKRDSAEKEIFDALPTVIAKRIKAIKPPNFKIKEIELKLQLSGKIYVAQIGGVVTVKLSPE
jgi:hypothetical protein